VASTPLFTRPFVVTCLATFFFYLSFYLILPVMPLYLADMGGTSTQLGLIIGLFAFMAMILRPPTGWIIDTRGSFLVLVAGMVIFFLASLGYVLARSVDAVLALRLFHGTGMGLFPTAATVVVAELAPLARRGEAMGWFGIANSVGMVFGPAAGTAVAGRLGFPVLFLLAAGVALLGLLCVGMLPKVGRPSAGKSPRPRLEDFFSPPAVLPSAILLCLYIPYGAMVAFIPIIATERGLANAGVFYTVFAVAVLLVRARAGRLSDEKGRAAVILPGMLVASVAFATLGLTSGSIGVLASAAIYGIAFGAAQPALLALTADRVAPEERGKAMGTFYAAWELGISSGAVAAGLLLKVTDFPVMWLWSAAMPVLGALLSLKARSSPLPRQP
jgi:predicted MFS family arabinose efflux permease